MAPAYVVVIPSSFKPLTSSLPCTYHSPSTMSLDEKFSRAVWLIRNAPPKESSNETKLNFYKYYKQATEGDVTGSQPWAVQVEARAKWDAWNSVKGVGKEEAKQHYIDLLAKDEPAWEANPALANYTSN